MGSQSSVYGYAIEFRVEAGVPEEGDPFDPTPFEFQVTFTVAVCVDPWGHPFGNTLQS